MRELISKLILRLGRKIEPHNDVATSEPLPDDLQFSLILKIIEHGKADPDFMAEITALVADAGYDINNVGLDAYVVSRNK